MNKYRVSNSIKLFSCFCRVCPYCVLIAELHFIAQMQHCYSLAPQQKSYLSNRQNGLRLSYFLEKQRKSKPNFTLQNEIPHGEAEIEKCLARGSAWNEK